MPILPAVSVTRAVLAVDRQPNQLPLERPVEIPLIVGMVLEVPHQLAGIGIDRQRRIGVERVVGHARRADRLHQRAGVVGVAGAEVGEAGAADRSCPASTPTRRCAAAAACRSSCRRRACPAARWCGRATRCGRSRRRGRRSRALRAWRRRRCPTVPIITLPRATSGPPPICSRTFGSPTVCSHTSVPVFASSAMTCTSDVPM